MAIAIREEAVEAQVATYGGAFGTGLLLGWVSTQRPGWGVGATLLAGAGGAIGAIMTKGFPSRMLQGMGAAAMGALGASVPLLMKESGTGAQGNGRKYLPAGRNPVSDAIARSARSSVEF